MQYLKTETKDNYVIITLDRGKASPMNEALIIEMRELIKKLENDPHVQGAILTGKEHIFSAGLDVLELYENNEEQMMQFWVNFSSLIRELAAFKKPIVCAVTGHSPAGGCILALCCDYRIMATGNYKIGLNEIPVGITLPDIVMPLYTFVIGTRTAYQFIMEGKLSTPEEALAVKLVDEICSADELMDRAEKKLQTYLSFDPETWQNSKQNMRKDLIKALSPDFETGFRVTLDQWWSAGSRERLGNLVASLKK